MGTYRVSEPKIQLLKEIIVIPKTISTSTLTVASNVALNAQIASRAGTLSSPWGQIYRMIHNEILRRSGHMH